jgi:uncharacterized membrane protein YvbJ
MKTMYTCTAIVAAIAVIIVGVTLLFQTPGTASVEKTAQYQQSAINQNPTAKVQNSAAPNSDNHRINENGFGDLDGD